MTLCLISVISVFAHPGRTDQNGGHWDRENGTYHFHTGEYAGRGGGGSSDSEYIPFVPPYDPPTENPYRNSSANLDADFGVIDILGMIISAMVCIWVIFLFVEFDFEQNNGCFTIAIVAILLIYAIGYLIEKQTIWFFCLVLVVVTVIFLVFKSKKTYMNAITDINNYNNLLYRLKHCLEELIQINNQIERYKIIHIPNMYKIGSDNLPKEKNSVSNWGKTFTLYKTKSGKKLHAKYNCCSATEPLHIYCCRNYRNFSELFCKKCTDNYVIPDLSWYDDYLKHEKAKKQQKNIEKNCDKMWEEIRNLYKKCNSIKTKIFIMFSKRDKQALQKANEKYIAIHHTPWH